MDNSISKDMLDVDRVPAHIAIIMDGNGRWAEKRGLPRTAGHKAGAETLRKILRIAGEVGVKVITAYAFSTENWKRPAYEVNFLMSLLDSYLTDEIENLNKDNVKVVFSGDLSRLPGRVRDKAEKTAAITSHNTGLILNLAINYGGQAEIINAVNRIITDVKASVITSDTIDKNTFEGYLYTAGLPDLDLLIRPGGDMRISNFLLWQIAYAEIWFTHTFWPDMQDTDIYRAIYDFQQRNRRFGGLNK